MTCIRVLIIDDSVTIRAMLEQLIADVAGCVVAGIAATAEEASDLMLSGRFDVMTLDLTMPGLGGMQFIRNLRDRPHPPIVVLSSSSTHGASESQEAVEAGASACFDKAKLLSDFPSFVRILRTTGKDLRHAARAAPTSKTAAEHAKRTAKFMSSDQERSWITP